MPSAYTGPVLYIVHAPMLKYIACVEHFDKNSVGYKLASANLKRVQQALQKAALHNIPVVYEAGSEYSESLQKFVSGLKAKPRIVWVDSIRKTLLDGVLHLEIRFRQEGIVPTKITALGAVRDACVIKGLRQLRRIFPKVEINMLEGASTFQPKWQGTPKRLALNSELKSLRIKRSKKLNIRHLI